MLWVLRYGRRDLSRLFLKVVQEAFSRSNFPVLAREPAVEQKRQAGEGHRCQESHSPQQDQEGVQERVVMENACRLRETVVGLVDWVLGPAGPVQPNQCQPLDNTIRTPNPSWSLQSIWEYRFP